MYFKILTKNYKNFVGFVVADLGLLVSKKIEQTLPLPWGQKKPKVDEASSVFRFHNLYFINKNNSNKSEDSG